MTARGGSGSGDVVGRGISGAPRVHVKRRLHESWWRPASRCQAVASDIERWVALARSALVMPASANRRTKEEGSDRAGRLWSRAAPRRILPSEREGCAEKLSTGASAGPRRILLGYRAPFVEKRAPALLPPPPRICSQATCSSESDRTARHKRLTTPLADRPGRTRPSARRRRAGPPRSRSPPRPRPGGRRRRPCPSPPTPGRRRSPAPASDRSSAARIRVSAFSAAFETLYAGVPAPMSDSDPLPLDTLTIRGCGLWRRSGRNASAVRQAPNRFVSIARCTAVEVGGGRPRVGVVVDRRVVDERVAAPERVPDPGRRPPATLASSATSSAHATIPAEAPPSSAAAASPRRGVARAEHDPVARGRERPRDLAPDPAVGARHDGDGPIVLCHVPSRSSAATQCRSRRRRARDAIGAARAGRRTAGGRARAAAASAAGRDRRRTARTPPRTA